ncbi:helix-turn-helix domain-containing protein [Ferrimonas balearica]|uniref:helix-turn-helix domain-containing protein n=1 Tax=Ferrimonas balearica TaxID=44012 RepID=UPI001F2F8512|nr:helix-turn-helix transcriptional regulator [Ferrimonas balearica]MBY6095139.1 helix-turn-helix domain-containing protein [Ferrimonas balearica]
MNPSEFLDMVKAALGLDTDYKVAKYFGLTPQAVGKWRQNISYPDDKLLIEIARVTQIDIAVLLLHGAIWRGKQKATSQHWERILSAYENEAENKRKD